MWLDLTASSSSSSYHFLKCLSKKWNDILLLDPIIIITIGVIIINIINAIEQSAERSKPKHDYYYYYYYTRIWITSCSFCLKGQAAISNTLTNHLNPKLPLKPSENYM
jgi:archaellum biogenesis protein FlaJ (TadC family)